MPLAGLINNPIYALLTILLTSDVIAIFLASQSVPYHRLGRSVQSETQAVRTKPIVPTSVTRLGDLLHFGHLLKPLATINLPKSHTILGNFCKGVKISHFSSEIIFGATFVDIWRLFTGHTAK